MTLMNAPKKIGLPRTNSLEVIFIHTAFKIRLSFEKIILSYQEWRWPGWAEQTDSVSFLSSSLGSSVLRSSASYSDRGPYPHLALVDNVRTRHIGIQSSQIIRLYEHFYLHLNNVYRVSQKNAPSFGFLDITPLWKGLGSNVGSVLKNSGNSLSDRPQNLQFDLLEAEKIGSKVGDTTLKNL